jgi:site-specific DNA-methyltransferase (adenine-specific)
VPPYPVPRTPRAPARLRSDVASDVPPDAPPANASPAVVAQQTLFPDDSGTGNHAAHQPVITTDLGSLVLGCGVSWLEARAPGSVDLVVTDPPYGIGKAAWDCFGSREEYLAWVARWVDAAHRALTPTGTLYVMGFSEVLAEILVTVQSGWDSVHWLVWAYRNKANLKDDWGRSHESVLHLRKGRGFTFNTDAVRVPYNAHTVRYPARTQGESSQYGGAERGGKKSDTWTPNPLGARPRDVLEIPVLCNGTAEKTSHPTQKPVQLIRKLVLASSNPGDLVVDPFSGSGTTALVCELHGRRWVGCERDPGYATLSAARLKDPRAHAGSQTTDGEAALADRRGKLRQAKPRKAKAEPATAPE